MKQVTKKDSGIVYLLAVLLPQIVGGIVLGIFCSFFESTAIAQTSIWYTYLSALLPQICFCLIYIFYTKYQKIDHQQLLNHHSKPTVKNALFVVLISLILFCTLYYFIDLTQIFFAYLGLDLTKFATSIPNTSLLNLIANIFLMAILPAIFEELIFRGVIYSGLKGFGKTLAIILSACMFSVMHLSILQFIYPLIMGVIFALVFDKTNCIYYTMILHFCNNLLVLVVDYFNGIYLFNLSFAITPLSVILILLGAILGIFLVILIIKKFLTKTPNAQTEYTTDYQKSNDVPLVLTISWGVAIFLWALALII